MSSALATSEADRPHISGSSARIPTFALVDHGLTNGGGHNLTYCRRVLAAAVESGLRVVAGVGRSGGAYDLCAPSLALFSRDVWKNNPAEGRRWHAAAALDSLRRRSRRLASTLLERPVGEPSHGEPTGAQGSALTSGHLASLARGLGEDAAALLAASASGRFFARELEVFVAQARLEPGDVVYLPTLLAAELRGLEHLLDHCEPARRLRWRLMLRYAPRARSVRAGIAASCRRLHDREGVDVRFFSDTEQLCRMYEALCGAPFHLVPVPVDIEGAPAAESGGDLVIGYFGDARDEKGFDLLPLVIRHVRQGATAERPIRFVVQMNLNTPEGDPRTRAARLELIGLGGGDLELIEGPLPLDAYQGRMRAANIVVLPYEPHAYAERSSGILMDALMAGAPCVVTGGGWMATMIEAAEASSPAGVVAAADPRAIADAVLRIAADWPRYARGARSLREKLRPRYDPLELVRIVTQDA